MSFKCFCDVCGAEIEDRDGERVRRLLGKVMVEIMVRYENTWNAGQVCTPCVIKVVNEGRPAQQNQSWGSDRIAALAQPDPHGKLA